MVTHAGDAAVRRVDQLGVHGHPDVRVRARWGGEGEDCQGDQQKAEGSGHAAHNITECGVKVASKAKRLSRYAKPLFDVHDSEDSLNYDMTGVRRAAGCQE